MAEQKIKRHCSEDIRPKRPRHKKMHCGDKRRFMSRELAESVMGDIKARGMVEGESGTYKCSECGFWHWGHRSKRTRVA